MSRHFTTLTFFILATYCSGQSGPYLFSGTKYLSNGQIGLLMDNAEAAIVQPALLPQSQRGGWAAGAAIRDGLNDLTELAAAAHIKMPWNDHVGFGIQHTGIEGVSEQRITLSYARKLSRKINAAVQFDLNRNSAVEYQDLYAASWSLNLLAPLSRELTMSAFLYNPFGQVSRLDLPAIARIGMKYHPSEKASFAIEAEKDWQHELRLKGGILYHIHPQLSVSWGVSTEPAWVQAGLSWNILQKMAVSGGWRYHSRLGSVLSGSISQNNRR